MPTTPKKNLKNSSIKSDNLKSKNDESNLSSSTFYEEESENEKLDPHATLSELEDYDPIFSASLFQSILDQDSADEDERRENLSSPATFHFPSSETSSSSINDSPVAAKKSSAIETKEENFNTPPKHLQSSNPTPLTKIILPHVAKVSAARDKINAAKSTRGKFHKRPWENLFDGNICIGEDHNDLNPKKFIIENLDVLKSKGYDCIIMEHLSQAEHQQLLDEFFKSKTMSPELEEYLDELNEGHMDEFNSEKKKHVKLYNFKTLIIEAAKAEIRIVALEESMRVYWNPYYKEGENRMLILNSLFLDRIAALETELEREPKWVAFVGSGHVNTHENAPGIADITDCQDLFIRDINDDKTEYLHESDKKKFFNIAQKSSSENNSLEQENGYLASMVLNKKWHDSSMKFADNLALPANDKTSSSADLSLTKPPSDADFGSIKDLQFEENFSEDKTGSSPKAYLGKRIESPGSAVNNKTKMTKF